MVTRRMQGVSSVRRMNKVSMESDFGSLAFELIHGRQYASGEEANRDMVATIEGDHNLTYFHSMSGYIHPAQAERRVV